ncbi:MAG: hypothetical protein QXZ41_08700 [Ignisphaera sp.]|uniref:Uncharacterized protein n=1 Tax=Ignisphaera aggregans TaxID=334771 RepID=A0A832CA27_9CREN
MYIYLKIICRFILILVLVLTILIQPTIKAYGIAIDIDGLDSEWAHNNSCHCCLVPLNQPQENKEVRLCCEDPSIPTKCQLIWVDGLDINPQAFADLYYARLFINASDIYFFIAIEPGNAANKDGIIWVNFTNNNNIISIKISLSYGSGGSTKPPLRSIDISVYYNNNQFNAGIISKNNRVTIDGHVYDFIEAKVSSISLPSSSTLAVILSVHKNVVDFAQTPSGDTELNLFLDENCFISGASYGSPPVTVIPVPVPEPWVIAPATVLMTLVIIFVVSKKW